MQENTRSLTRWFARNARELPWRRRVREPYHVLVSELMLQQTQVDRVVPRFLAFIERFPSVTHLAQASEEDVLEAWSGLGYYSRARNLHRAAQVVARAGGEIPRDIEGLLALPGIGAYTAAAVASLAFGIDAPVLDGNVMRVASRVLAREGDPRKAAEARALTAWVSGLIEAHEGSSAAINEALMELGAVVCTPKKPGCDACPLSEECLAHSSGQPEEFPRVPRSRTHKPVVELRWIAACCVDGHGRWLLTRVDDGPVLRRLWLPPLDRTGSLEDPVVQALRLVPGLESDDLRWREHGVPVVFEAVRHSITFRRIRVTPVSIVVSQLEPPTESDWVWADPRDPGRPTSSLLGKLVAKITGS